MQMARRTSNLVTFLFSKIHLDSIQASPTLDLVRDYFRFTTTFFEVINTSAPHIYHSALPLSPQTSIVHELYKRHTRPFVRVVRGSPISWDPVVAIKDYERLRSGVVWSPCGKFIAVAKDDIAEIFDGVTLGRLDTFIPPFVDSWGLSFSSDSRFLTQYDSGFVTVWDLQTGGPLGTIAGPNTESGLHSCAYSADGKVFVAAGGIPNDMYIDTYDLLSRTHKGSYRVSEGSVIGPIWTRGECLRFATPGEGRRVTVWEAAFTFTHPPAEVASLPVPSNIDYALGVLFHPTPPRLAFVLERKILVWDTGTSKLLLESDPILDHDFISPGQMSFSSDGHVFACIAGTTPEARVWRESPTGYTLNQSLIFPGGINSFYPRAFLSPNGESIVAYVSDAIRLWHTRLRVLPRTEPKVPEVSRTEWVSAINWNALLAFLFSWLTWFGSQLQHYARDQVPSRPDAPFQKGRFPHFVLTFSADGRSAAFVRGLESVVTVLDLQSGDPRLVIDTGMRVDCLGVAGDTVVVAEKEKVVTWKLPAGGRAINARANIADSIRTTTLDISPRRYLGYTSISPDLSHIVVARKLESFGNTLDIYDVPTGRRLAGTEPVNLFPRSPRFTPDGREVWSGSSLKSWDLGWEILQDGESGRTELKSLCQTACPWNPPPWRSFDGYEVTEDGWVLSPTQKRLLLLPHHWRMGDFARKWDGRYLGLRFSELAEVVILEFPE